VSTETDYEWLLLSGGRYRNLSIKESMTMAKPFLSFAADVDGVRSEIGKCYRWTSARFQRSADQTIDHAQISRIPLSHLLL
jgi:hypothetical protein